MANNSQMLTQHSFLPYKNKQITSYSPLQICSQVMMNKFVSLCKKTEHLQCLAHSFRTVLRYLAHSFRIVYFYLYRVLVFQVNPFWIQLPYLLIISSFGYLFLKNSMPKGAIFKPTNFDLFFMSVSASTLSSMSTVEVEVFSNTQLVIFTILMFVCGEVFVSMIGLQLQRLKFTKQEGTENRVNSSSNSINSLYELELGSISQHQINVSKESGNLQYNSIVILGYVVLGYLLVIHVLGSSLVAICIYFLESSKQVLKTKGLSLITFSIFTTVSTFSNTGLVPTNENMMIFRKNTALLLVLVPQVLFGNTLYPPTLRFVIGFLEWKTKRKEYGYILRNWRDLGYDYFLSKLRCRCLLATVFGLILVMFIGFASMEWNSKVMEGLSAYEKSVGTLFVTVNSRHAGESVFDFSIVSSALLVLLVFTMYLPPFTSFVPVEDKEVISDADKGKRKTKFAMQNLVFSQLSYLVIFTIFISITERQKLKDDPLNFSVLNIIFEVTSAYGNVGFSTGYSCQRRLNQEGYCKDAYYGFVGRWSDKGKFILILVMIFGRLKRFSFKGGRSWKLSQ